MIDFTSELGARALQRIQEDFFLWLTTNDAAGFPQPRPVWFIWDGNAFLVYSQPPTHPSQQRAPPAPVFGARGWSTSSRITRLFLDDLPELSAIPLEDPDPPQVFAFE